MKKPGKKTAGQHNCSDIMLIFAFIFIADAFSAELLCDDSVIGFRFRADGGTATDSMYSHHGRMSLSGMPSPTIAGFMLSMSCMAPLTTVSCSASSIG